MKFFIGLHQPSDAKHFDQSMISITRLRNRKSNFEVSDWMMDSGAFMELRNHGEYRHTVREYADQVLRWSTCGNLLAAVSQDYMCEPFMLARTGKTVKEHQYLTIDRYDELLSIVGNRQYILPVLQGYTPQDYQKHISDYDTRLEIGAWVGVGSVCKRNISPAEIIEVLSAIKSIRPDLRMHGFGIKTTSLKHSLVRELLYSADSMAWCFHAYKNGGDANDWREAKMFAENVNRPAIKHHHQYSLL